MPRGHIIRNIINWGQTSTRPKIHLVKYMIMNTFSLTQVNLRQSSILEKLFDLMNYG